MENKNKINNVIQQIYSLQQNLFLKFKIIRKKRLIPLMIQLNSSQKNLFPNANNFPIGSSDLSENHNFTMPQWMPTYASTYIILFKANLMKKNDLNFIVYNILLLISLARLILNNYCIKLTTAKYYFNIFIPRILTKLHIINQYFLSNYL